MEGEHGVRGRRRVDCIGRVVTRPSDREIASQCVVIAGWPVQFLPAGTALLQEALAAAVEKDVEGTPARVLTAEHIAASRWKQVGPKTRRACFNSSRPAPSISTGCEKSWRIMV